jgi:threonylcarbamoyladenosine tRNA methylthiotransferase MtaB
VNKKESVAFHTLGCKLNFSETSTIARQFDKEGFQKREFNQEADIYVINTCSVTENADKECKQLIRRVKKLNPSSKIVITGCYAQLKPEAIAALDGVDIVIGASEKFNIVHHVKSHQASDEAKICSCDIDDHHSFQSAYSIAERTRTFLKIQDGCDYTCSFCTIPLARGKSRSDSIQGVLANVDELTKSGVQEIVLTGVNIGDFGKGYHSNAKQETFFDLMQALESTTQMPRYRISSIEPNLLANEMIDFVATSTRFMPHFHIPLQSGSDYLLGQMRRRYQRSLYADKVNYIKKAMPHCCIGVDVIVGFPGETDEIFDDTFHFLHQLDISYLHVFTYSERENTKAIEFNGVVPPAKRKERNAVLRNLSEKKMNFFREQCRGQKRSVLFEQNSINGYMEGFTDNYIKVCIPYDASCINRIEDRVID